MIIMFKYFPQNLNLTWIFFWTAILQSFNSLYCVTGIGNDLLRHLKILICCILYAIGLSASGSQSSNKGPAVGTHGLNPNRSATVDSISPSNQLLRKGDSEFTISKEMKLEKPTIDNDREGNLKDKSKLLQPESEVAARDDLKVQKFKGKTLSLVFKGRKFRFSKGFPEDRVRCLGCLIITDVLLLLYCTIETIGLG